jgi:hypothetical protein
MLSTSDAASGVQLPARVQTYIEALVQTCAQDRAPLVSVVLFGIPSRIMAYFESTSDASGYQTCPQLGCLHSRR